MAVAQRILVPGFGPVWTDDDYILIYFERGPSREAAEYGVPGAPSRKGFGAPVSTGGMRGLVLGPGAVNFDMSLNSLIRLGPQLFTARLDSGQAVCEVGFDEMCVARQTHC